MPPSKRGFQRKQILPASKRTTTRTIFVQRSYWMCSEETLQAVSKKNQAFECNLPEHQGERLSIFCRSAGSFTTGRTSLRGTRPLRWGRSSLGSSRVLEWEVLRLRSFLTPLRMTEVWDAFVLAGASVLGQRQGSGADREGRVQPSSVGSALVLPRRWKVLRLATLAQDDRRFGGEGWFQ